MSQLLVAATLSLFLGVVLLLSLLRWFSRRPLVERLGRHGPAGLAAASSSGIFSVESFRDVIAPLSQAVGASVARLFGVSEELETRLRRIHSPLDVVAFRTRQVGWSLIAFLAAVLLALVAGLPPAVTFLFTVASPLLVFLVLEQQVANASQARQRRLFLELPVVTEQLGMLLSAGYSLSGALHRLAERGHGVCAEELAIVGTRTRQGLTEIEALREWATLANVDGLDRLVSVLALNRQASDLGALIAEEARSIRRDTHRELLEAIERKNLQVWVPVTVATLLPGVILIAVPFLDALNTFSSG